MPVTETTICNGALLLLSEAPITSLQQANEQARMCNESYPVARRMCLQMHDWKFATRRALLTRLEATPSFGYQYKYQLPVDLLSISSVYPPDMCYTIEDDELLTDYATPGIIYTVDVEDTGRFSPLFVVAVELVLAGRLCMAIAEKRNLRADFKEELIFTLAQAKIRDTKMNPSQRPIEVEMDQVRRTVESAWD